jgi:glycosyltransferase involved in cell wall biosynthesis
LRSADHIPLSTGERRPLLYVIGSLNIGGTERHLSMVARGLVKRGWQVVVYSLTGRGPLAPELQKAGVIVAHPPMQVGPISFRRLKILRRLVGVIHLFKTMALGRFAIAHFYLPHAYFIGAPLAFCARIPLRVMSRRSSNLYQKKRLFTRQAERVLHKTVDVVVANSMRVWGELHDGEHLPTARLALIYNGVDLDRFSIPGGRASARAALGWDHSQFIMISVANLIPYKGHSDLLYAASIAAPKLPAGWQLVIVGRNDGLESDLREQARRIGIGEHVHFLGVRHDVPTLLNGSDIGLLSSHEEGFPNFVLEGMASGLPMIVTDVGGAAEAIENECSGIVVAPRDSMGMATAMVRLSRDPSLRLKFKAAAQLKVAKLFSLDQCLNDYECLYRALLANGSVPSDLQPQLGGSDQTQSDRIRACISA